MAITQQKDKSGLGTMLFALGGALRGDKDFVAKAIQLKEMKESKEKKNKQEEAWKSWKENNLDSIPDSFKSLVDIMDAEQGINLAVKTLQPKTNTDIPADIQKLNQVKLLRDKLRPSSSSYDPSYTEERFRQDASVLGVSSNLFAKTKTEFIEEYMKQMRGMKSPNTGRPLYGDEELKINAESAYELIYGQQPNLPDVIDLGTLD